MSLNNDLIDLSLKGNRADFTFGDVLTTLILISQETMGRYKLQIELALTESNAKSLLNYCKKENLLESTRGRAGHSLSTKGKKIISIIEKYIIDHGEFVYQVFPQKFHYYVQISSENRIDYQSWKIRDMAVSFGCEAILVLKIDDEGKLYFPEKELKLEKFYPDMITKANELFMEKLRENSLILIVSAPELVIARKGAIMTAMNLSEGLVSILKTYL
ncbi:MAG: DUF4443 domain-containing protein [Candidatus Thorarchaeota archaeon]